MTSLQAIKDEIERLRKIDRVAFEKEYITPDIFHGRNQVENHLFSFIESLTKYFLKYDNVITEDYVSFEIAKLLKEKGFDGECIAYYSRYKDNNTNLHRWRNRQNYVNVRNNDYTLVPTLQMAMKWLRKKYNIHIEPRYFPMPNIYRYVIIHSPTTIENIDSHPQYFNTHEEACKSAIKYCLENLI